jgi:hypothetical protein
VTLKVLDELSKEMKGIATVWSCELSTIFNLKLFMNLPGSILRIFYIALGLGLCAIDPHFSL